jgi:hypothetical protein
MATLRAKTFTAKVEHLGPVIPGSIQMAVDWVNEAWTSKLVGSDVEKCRIANGDIVSIDTVHEYGYWMTTVYYLES